MALHRKSWYVIDLELLTGAAVARYPFAWMARLHCALGIVPLDYTRPGESKIVGIS